MTRRLHRAQLDRADAQCFAIANGAMRKLRVRVRADDDLRAGARGELAMSAHEVGVEMRLDDVANGQSAVRRLIDVLIDIALRIDDRALAAVADQI